VSTEAAVPFDIRIDRDTCMGSGTCSFWAPGVFDLDDEGIAVVVDAGAQPDDKVVLAAQGCPTQAISLYRDGEQVV
jgi:ferredoxin